MYLVSLRVLEHVEVDLLRHVLDAGDHVVAKVAVLQLAVVKDHFLEERLADTEGDIALGLQFGLNRVDDATCVDAGVVVEQVDPTRLEVDLDLRGCGSLMPMHAADTLPGVGIETGLGRERSVAQEIAGATAPNDLSVCQGRLRNAHHLNGAVDQLEVVDGHLEQICSLREQLSAIFADRYYDRVPPRKRSAP